MFSKTEKRMTSMQVITEHEVQCLSYSVRNQVLRKFSPFHAFGVLKKCSDHKNTMGLQ